MIIKVCGMRDADNIREVESLGVDWMGFIFYGSSSRFVDECPSYLPEHCQRVGVFVNSPEEEIILRTQEFGLHYVQLHGDESPAFCRHLRSVLPVDLGIIKMMGISSESDMGATASYAPYVDYFLFESPCASYGGSGKKFDWTLLKHYEGETPFILTGGIGPGDAGEIMELSHPRFSGIDLNSRFETSPGLKNPDQLRQFIKTIRRL